MELKEKIKLTLVEERTRKLDESYAEFKDIPKESFPMEKYITISSKLLDEGYTINEIESTDVSKQLNTFDWKKGMGDSAVSSSKEYVIRFVLTAVFGKEHPDLITTASQIMADISPLDMLKPFKNEQYCIQYFPKISNAILEAMVRYYGGQKLGIDRNNYGINVGGVASTLGGNFIGEIIQQSNISQVISDKFYKFIH
jgi:hypothetical protein